MGGPGICSQVIFDSGSGQYLGIPLLGHLPCEIFGLGLVHFPSSLPVWCDPLIWAYGCDVLGNLGSPSPHMCVESLVLHLTSSGAQGSSTPWTLSKLFSEAGMIWLPLPFFVP